MSNLTKLEEEVKALYDARDPAREEWADWLAVHHVPVVADYATELAKRFGGNNDLARAAALLHDIADVNTDRFDPEHEAKSLAIARELLMRCGYSEVEVQLIADDAIRYHSCHDGQVPTSLEGKILATADAMAHLKTDFYLYALYQRSKRESLADFKVWASKKLERDYHIKIRFDEVRSETRAEYEVLRTLFTR